MTMFPQTYLFRSQVMAGFEGACQIAPNGRRNDLLKTTQHEEQVAHDYKLLSDMGIHTVRDGLRWHRIERHNNKFDYSSFTPMLEAAYQQNMQVVWTLMHYGWPDDIDLLKPHFVDRFAQYCNNVASIVKEYSDEVPFYNPINEISFLAFAQDVGFEMYPHAKGKGWELKQQLVRAEIAGIEAIRDVDPRARFVHIDPALNIAAPLNAKADEHERALAETHIQYQAWDMIGGDLCPELGGSPEYRDIIGFNSYQNSQWDFITGQQLAWQDHDRDPRRLSLSDTATLLYQRYRRPVIISETGGVGEGRHLWARQVTQSVT